MRGEILNTILVDLVSASGDIEAASIVSVDGLNMADHLPQGMDADRVGAMSAAMKSLGERTAKELARGAVEQVLVKGENGYVVMTGAGDDAVLTVLTHSKAKLGLVFLDIKRAIDRIQEVL